MNTVTRLKCHYKHTPPQILFGGLVGNDHLHKEWPEMLDKENLGIRVWEKSIESNSDASCPVDGYYVIDECLDPRGDQTPPVLTLPLNTQGHDLHIIVYVDIFNRICMRAIVGATVQNVQAENS
jgi:hypothetical protein